MKTITVLVIILALAWPARAGSLTITTKGSDGQTSTVKKNYEGNPYNKPKGRSRGRSGSSNQPASQPSAAEAEKARVDALYKTTVQKVEQLDQQMKDVVDAFKKDAQKMR